MYKVVRHYNYALYSSHAQGEAMVKYQVGEWAEPPQYALEAGFGLFVFRSKDAALEAASEGSDLVVFEAEAESPLPSPQFALDKWELWWGRAETTRYPFQLAPDEMMYRRVRLVRPVARHIYCFVRSGEEWQHDVPVFLRPNNIPRGEGVWLAFGLVDLDALVGKRVRVIGELVSIRGRELVR